jgi:hypothetical protein
VQWSRSRSRRARGLAARLRALRRRKYRGVVETARAGALRCTRPSLNGNDAELPLLEGALGDADHSGLAPLWPATSAQTGTSIHDRRLSR